MISTYIKLDTRGMDRVEREIGKRADSAVRALANHIVDDINSNWSGKYPPASTKGNPPAYRTEKLMKSVSINLREKGKFTSKVNAHAVSIFYRAPYAKFLEDETVLNRPFLFPAVFRAEKFIAFYMIKFKVARP